MFLKEGKKAKKPTCPSADLESMKEDSVCFEEQSGEWKKCISSHGLNFITFWVNNPQGPILYLTCLCYASARVMCAKL